MVNQINNTNQVFSSQDSEETRIMYSPSDNKEAMISIATDKIIEDLFYSCLQRYQ